MFKAFREFVVGGNKQPGNWNGLLSFWFELK
ncbi:hypothetical protein G3A_10285 [Bacillus sp. 17376]|nr:hypothetical protein G3A_10285 [Bacillus sp. 17376]